MSEVPKGVSPPGGTHYLCWAWNPYKKFFMSKVLPKVGVQTNTKLVSFQMPAVSLVRLNERLLTPKIIV